MSKVGRCPFCFFDRLATGLGGYSDIWITRGAGPADTQTVDDVRLWAQLPERVRSADHLALFLARDTLRTIRHSRHAAWIAACTGGRQSTKARFALPGPQEVRRFPEKLDRELRESR